MSLTSVRKSPASKRPVTEEKMPPDRVQEGTVERQRKIDALVRSRQPSGGDAAGECFRCLADPVAGRGELELSARFTRNFVGQWAGLMELG